MKIKRIILIATLLILISTSCYANIIKLEKNRIVKESSYYTVIISIKFDEIPNDICFLYGKLEYDREIFEQIDIMDIELLDGWYDIVFNSDNGIFIVECNNAYKEVMKVKLRTKVILSGNTDINLSDITFIGEDEEEKKIDDATVTISFINEDEENSNEANQSTNINNTNLNEQNSNNDVEITNTNLQNQNLNLELNSNDKGNKSGISSLLPNFKQLPQTGSITSIIVILLIIILLIIIIRIINKNRRLKKD